MKFKKVYVEVTNICNKSCSFCPTSSRKKREMSVGEFKITINKIKNITNYIYMHIKGEPLLHSSFPTLIQICKDNNINVNITTNGTLIKKQLNILKSNIIRQINISFHSYDNLDEIKEIFKLCDDILIHNNNVNIVYRFWTYSKENENFNNLINMICDYYDCNDKKQNLLDIMNIKIKDRLYFNKDLEFEWPSLNNNIKNLNGFCYGLKTHIGILSDGTVVPCCLDQDGIINLGNIFTQEINDILSNERTKKIIENFKENKRCEELCQHCSFKR